MNKENLNYLTDNVFLQQFLINFIPGFPLFFIIKQTVLFSIDGNLTSFLVVSSFSWILGLILEIVLFNRHYKKRFEEGYTFQKKQFHYLLITKLSIAIVIGSFLGFIFLLFLGMGKNIVESNFIGRQIISGFIVSILAFISWIHFKKKLD